MAVSHSKRAQRAGFLACVFVWLQISTALADPAPAPAPKTTPESLPGITRVDAEGLIDLVDDAPDLVLVDARLRLDRKQVYIDGSVSLPDTETDCDRLSRIAPEKTGPLLFYCNGPKCGRSARAAQTALACGYGHVYWFRGGIEEWLRKGYAFLKE